MNKIYKVFAALTITGFVTLSGHAFAQGYSGLFADDASKTDSGQDNQPPGYAGVIDGAVPQRPVEAPAAPTASQQTPNPATQQQPLTTSEQLQQQAIINKATEDGKAALAGKPENWQGLTNQERVNGLLPVAYSIKQILDSYMSMLNDPKLTPQKRAETGRLIYNRVVTMTEGFQAKKSIPEEVYKQMGVPVSYAKDEMEANQQALQLLQKSLETLRQYK